VCASGRCDREAGVCAERAPAGATCDDSGECAEGLKCGLNPETFVGVCEAEGGGTNNDRAERCASFDQWTGGQ